VARPKVAATAWVARSARCDPQYVRRGSEMRYIGLFTLEYTSFLLFSNNYEVLRLNRENLMMYGKKREYFTASGDGEAP
jgi:hypothetical protein